MLHITKKIEFFITELFNCYPTELSQIYCVHMVDYVCKSLKLWPECASSLTDLVRDGTIFFTEQYKVTELPECLLKVRDAVHDNLNNASCTKPAKYT